MQTVESPHIHTVGGSVGSSDIFSISIALIEKAVPDLPAPELWINPEVTDFFKIDNSKDITDIKVLKYQHHGKISFPIAQ